MLSRMTAIMRHRGPDGDSFHLSPGVGLAMCRLDIKDPAASVGPVTNEDGSVVAVCNGEIYNHAALRERLLTKGHRFQTLTDVEVIVHLYEENPDEFLDELRGMFALAVWDAKRRRLVLASDRFGIKPLHWALTSQGLVFGSELKTVLASGLVAPQLDGQALRQVLRHGFVWTPRTMAANVSRVLPGEAVRFEEGKVTTKLYWDLSFPDADGYDRSVTADQWADGLREQIAGAVRVRLRGDASVIGSWLSGGIDSSVVTALMCRELRTPVHSFTLGYENQALDESCNRLLDAYPEFQLVGHRTECRRQHIDLLPQTVWHREQPLRAGVDIPRMIISEFTAKQIKVVLTGDASDTLLGGSSWFSANKVLAPFAPLPQPIRRMIARALSGRWPGAARILMAPAEINQARFEALTGLTAMKVPEDLLADERALASQDSPMLTLPDAFPRWHWFPQLQYFSIKAYFCRQVLLQTDLPAMAYSLETRIPFLDDAVVEFCARIPPWLNMRGLQKKYILQRAVRDILPPELCRRKKFAMAAPTRDWMTGALPEFAASLLSGQSVREKGHFNPSRVAALLAEHQTGQQDHSRLLMTILSTQLWDDLFVKRFSCATA